MYFFNEQEIRARLNADIAAALEEEKLADIAGAKKPNHKKATNKAERAANKKAKATKKAEEFGLKVGKELTREDYKKVLEMGTNSHINRVFEKDSKNAVRKDGKYPIFFEEDDETPWSLDDEKNYYIGFNYAMADYQLAIVKAELKEFGKTEEELEEELNKLNREIAENLLNNYTLLKYMYCEKTIEENEREISHIDSFFDKGRLDEDELDHYRAYATELYDEIRNCSIFIKTLETRARNAYEPDADPDLYEYDDTLYFIHRKVVIKDNFRKLHILKREYEEARREYENAFDEWNELPFWA